MSQSNKAARGIRPNVRFRPLTQNVSGTVTNRAERFMDVSQAVNIENMHAESEGSWTAARVGYTNRNATVYESGATSQGLHWYTTPAGVDRLIAGIDGKLISIDTTSYAATAVDTSTGFTTSSEVDFQSFDGYVYYCDGTASTPRRFDGTSATASGGWPALGTYTTPKYVEEHNGRLAYGNLSGNNSHVVLSNTGDGETFTTPIVLPTDAVALEVGVGDGQQITGMRSVFIPQSNETYLVVAKERSLFVITGVSSLATDADYFKVIKVNNTTGAVNNKSIVQVGNDLLMLSELAGGGFGVVNYTTALQNGTFQPTLIGSDYIKRVLNGVNRTAAHKSYAVHFPARREVVFGVPHGSSTTVNYWVVYKYPAVQGELPKWSIRTGITHPSGIVFKDKILFGTNNGYLSDWFTSSTYNGTTFQFTYEYPYTDLGMEGQFKRVTSAWAHFKTSVNATVTIQSRWLGGGNNDDKSVSVSAAASGSGSVYGTAIYGVDSYTGSVEKKRTFKVFGNGERLKFKISGSPSTSGGPEFLGITTHVEYGGPSHHYN